MTEKSGVVNHSSILESISEIFLVMNLDMEVIWLNRPALVVLGDSENQILGKKCHDIWHHSSENCTNCPAKECISNRTCSDGVIKTPHGKVWYIRCSPILDPETHEITSVLEFRRDITENYRLNQDLKKSEEKYRNIVETAREGIWEVDPFGETLYVNDRMARMLGFTLEEMKNVKLKELLQGAHTSNGIRNDRYPFNDTSVDFLLRRKNGSILNALINQNPVFNDAGDCIGVLYMVTDISRRMLLESNLRHRDEKLKVQNKRLLKKSIALEEVINQMQDQRKAIEENMIANVERVILPLINRMAEGKTGVDLTAVNLLRQSISDITSPFARNLRSYRDKLTDREWEICCLIRNGMSTKEIGEFLVISPKSVENHRYNIRKKLGINAKGSSLRLFLSKLKTTKD